MEVLKVGKVNTGVGVETEALAQYIEVKRNQGPQVHYECCRRGCGTPGHRHRLCSAVCVYPADCRKGDHPEAALFQLSLPTHFQFIPGKHSGCRDL